VCGETSIDGKAKITRTSCLVLETRDVGEELGVGLARKLKWNASRCLHVTHTRARARAHVHTHTPQLDTNTGKTGVAGSTMLQSGCDREDIETCRITDHAAFKFEWDYRGAGKSLARPTSRCILFDGENISFDASLVIYR